MTIKELKDFVTILERKYSENTEIVFFCREDNVSWHKIRNVRGFCYYVLDKEDGTEILIY